MTEVPKDYTRTEQEAFQRFSEESAWEKDATTLTRKLADGTKFEIFQEGPKTYLPRVTLPGGIKDVEYDDPMPSCPTKLAAMNHAWICYRGILLLKNISEENPPVQVTVV